MTSGTNACTTSGANCVPAARSISSRASPTLRFWRVDAVLGHRVERVDDGEDPRRDGDLEPAQPVRVAASVPALVMARDDVAHDRREERQRIDHLGAHERMRLDHGPLLLRQRPGLLEDVVGHPELADVVEDERVPEARRLGETRRDRGGELEREPRDPLDVAAGVTVAHAQGRDPCVDHDVGRIEEVPAGAVTEGDSHAVHSSSRPGGSNRCTCINLRALIQMPQGLFPADRRRRFFAVRCPIWNAN